MDNQTTYSITYFNQKIENINKKIKSETNESTLKDLHLKLTNFKRLLSEHLEQSLKLNETQQQLDKANQKIDNTNQQLDKTQQQLDKANQKIDIIEDNNTMVVYLKDKGVPIVSFVPTSKSEPSSNHKVCTAINGKFSNLDDPYCDETLLGGIISKVWSGPKGKMYEVSNEAETRAIFRDLLQDIINLCGFQKCLDIRIEYGITDLVPDFLLITDNGVPKGVVEIKRAPSHEISTIASRKIDGQIFDYMYMLKHLHNLKQVIGITSTYLETEFLWLEDDPLIHEKNINNIKNNITENKLRLNQQSVPTKLSKFSSPELIDSKTPTSKKSSRSGRPKEVKRVVYKSGIITQEDDNYVKSLCSVVQKMYYSQTNTEVGSSSRNYIQLNESSWFWVKLEHNIIPNYSQLINITENSSLDCPFLLEDLGTGGDGRCWLGFNLDSEVFVLKFFKNEDNSGLEKFVWETAWGIKTHISTLNNKKALIMPYFKILTDEDWNNDKMLNLVLEACRIFSKKGFYHQDLKKRHVAKYKESGEIKVVFIDLSRIEEIKVDRSKEMYNQIIEDPSKQPPNKVSIKLRPRNRQQQEEQENQEKQQKQKLLATPNKTTTTTTTTTTSHNTK